MTRYEIDIKDAPGSLQKAVKKYLDTYEESRLLAVVTSESNPYKDKTQIAKDYTAFLEWGNLLTVLEAPDYLNYEVQENQMIVEDLKVFIKKSKWFK